jgi:hypothetical protein
MLMEAANVESTIYKEDVDGGNKITILGLGAAGYSDQAGT